MVSCQGGHTAPDSKNWARSLITDFGPKYDPKAFIILTYIL